MKKLPLAIAILSASTAMQIMAETQGIEEVIVTAQKREQSFQDLAISASVITAEQLEAKGLTQIQDAIKSSPGVKIQNIAGTGSGRVFIRGIGTTSGDEFNGIIANGVSLNLDGINSNNASNMLGSMFDVERVEVLKGPQGTLYGSGALGGVVNVITTRPKLDTFEGKVKVQTGNYGQKSYQGVINIPVSETFALRVNASKDERDGYVDKPDWLTEDGVAGWQQIAANEGTPWDPIDIPGVGVVFPGYQFLLGFIGNVPDPENSVFGNYGAQDNDGYRVKALFEPNDKFSLLLSYESNEQTGTSSTWVSSANVRDGNLWCCSLIQETEETAGAPPSFATPQWYERRYFFREDETLTAEINYQMEQFADLTVIYSHNEIKDLGQELTTTELNTNMPTVQKQDIVDIRLNSLADSELIWVAGIYLQDTDRDWAINETAYTPSNVDGSYAYLNGGKPFTNANIYGQITYPVNDQLRYTLGGRFSQTQDEIQYSLYKTANPCPTGEPFCPKFDTVTEEHLYTTTGDKESSFTWKAGVEYDLDADRMVYAHVATGFKAPGLQYQNTTDPIMTANQVQLENYKPEESTAFEVGSKNRLLDNTLQINGALYYTEWDNMQVNTLACANSSGGCNFQDIAAGRTFTAWYNATTSTQYGLELDVIWLPIENGELSFSSSFMKGTYGKTSYLWAAPGFAGEVNLDGHEMANTPSYAGNVKYTHTFDLNNGAVVLATIEEEFSDSYEVTHEWWWLGATQDSFMRTNLSLSYLSDNFDVVAYARNLEDDKTIQSVFPFGVYGGEPRTYGASITFKF